MRSPITHVVFTFAMTSCRLSPSNEVPDVPVVPLVAAPPRVASPAPQPPAQPPSVPPPFVPSPPMPAPPPPAPQPPMTPVPFPADLDAQLTNSARICIRGEARGMGGITNWSWSIAAHDGRWVGAGFRSSFRDTQRFTLDLGAADVASLVTRMTHAPLPPEHRPDRFRSDQPSWQSNVEARLSGGAVMWQDSHDGPQWLFTSNGATGPISAGDPGSMLRDLETHARPAASNAPLPDHGGCGLADPAQQADQEFMPGVRVMPTQRRTH